MDTLLLSLVLQNIKVELHLSDTQLGLLTGIAFALFYSTMGVPIARWADRGNRVTIISVTTALWCGAVALCGMARSFLQLMLIRIGVAVGEAGCVPPAQSLIADYFSRAERPRAVAIYMLGGPASVLIGYFFGGWLTELYGWRTTFIMLGLPGLALAALAKMTLKEPRQAQPIAAPKLTESLSHPSPSLKEVCSALWASRSFRHVLFGYSIACFFSNGIAQWQPSFFARSFGLKTGELGTWLAMVYGLGGMVGIYAGGALATRFAADNERRQLKSIGWLYGAFGVISAGIYLSPNQYIAFGLMGLSFIGGAATAGPLFATIQTLVHERMRATAIAIIYLFANLIGMGCGPLAAGVLSDQLRPWSGEESLRYSLLILSPGYLWATLHLWRASQTVTRDLEAVRVQEHVAAT
jgi:MFS family permease